MATKKKVEKVKTIDGELKQISTDIVVQEKASKKIKVTNEKEFEKATEFLVMIKGQVDEAEKLKSFFTDPYVEQRRTALKKKNEIEALFDAQIDPFKSIMNGVKELTNAYAREQEAIAKKEEIRLQKLQNNRDAKALEKGVPVDFKPAPTVERREATTKIAGGKATVKKSWKFEVQDISKLPKNVIQAVIFEAQKKGLIDTVVRKMVATGIHEMSGVRIYEDFDTNISAK